MVKSFRSTIKYQSEVFTVRILTQTSDYIGSLTVHQVTSLMVIITDERYLRLPIFQDDIPGELADRDILRMKHGLILGLLS